MREGITGEPIRVGADDGRLNSCGTFGEFYKSCQANEVESGVDTQNRAELIMTEEWVMKGLAFLTKCQDIKGL